MDPILFVSMLVQLGFALLGVELALLLARRMDKRLGIDFGRDVWGVMKDDPLALALYCGCRILAVCLLIGFVVSG